MTGLLIMFEATWSSPQLNKNSKVSCCTKRKPLDFAPCDKCFLPKKRYPHHAVLIQLSQRGCEHKEPSHKRRGSPICQTAVIAQSVEHLTLDQKIVGSSHGGEIKIFHFLLKVVCVISAADVHSSGNLCTNDGGASLSW